MKQNKAKQKHDTHEIKWCIEVIIKIQPFDERHRENTMIENMCIDHRSIETSMDYYNLSIKRN